MNPVSFALAAVSQQQTCAGGAQLDAAHDTEQRGTHNWPEAEIYDVCRRRDVASLACLRTGLLVHTRGGQRWARARPEPERSRGSRWSTSRRRSV